MYKIASIILLFIMAIGFIWILHNANPDLFNAELYSETTSISTEDNEMSEEEWKDEIDNKIQNFLNSGPID